MLPQALVLARAYTLWIQTCWRCFFVHTKYYKQVLGGVDIGIAGAYAFMWAQIFPRLQYYPSNITFCEKMKHFWWDRPTLWMAQCPSERCFGMKLFSCRDFFFLFKVQSLIFEVLIVLTENKLSLLVCFYSSSCSKSSVIHGSPSFNQWISVTVIVYYFIYIFL